MEKTFLISKGSYINGDFVKTAGSSLSSSLSSRAKRYMIFSPADLSDRVFEFSSDPDHIELACSSAESAFPAWSALSQERRNSYLYRLARVYQEKEEEIALLISRETGKPLWESQLEAKALAQKIHITLKSALPLVQGTSLSALRAGTQGKVNYRPRGAFLVLGPFNFPAHLPNGHIIPALATGNTVVFKPSEKAPATAEKLAQCFARAGFPKGVFNLVQGAEDIAQALVQNRKLKGLLFTGSYAVGRKIQESLLSQPQKSLALEMGGKNSALVWKDADIENALYENLKGAYWSAGQRCSSTSRLILHKDIKEAFLKKFIRLSQRIKIGHWRDNPFMGPLIEEGSIFRLEKAVEEAKKEKALIHLPGERIKELNGYYTRPALVEPQKYSPSSFYQNEELFAPFLSVYEVEREEEALALINQSDYGLCLSVFSKEESFAKKMSVQAEVGVFHWNLSTCSASSRLPFGGLGKSGNDRPAGLFAVYSCLNPQAFLQKDFSVKTSPKLMLKDFLEPEFFTDV